MGSIKDGLKVVASCVGNEERMEGQLEFTGESIESELRELRSRIEELENDEGFRRHMEKIKRLEECRKYQQNWSLEIAKNIKKLEEKIEELEKKHQDPPPNSWAKEPAPTDKDKPKFQVGDTVAYWGRGNIRIVLEVNSDNTMKLMDMPGGAVRSTPGHPDNYTLIFRPKFPKDQK